MLLDKIHLLITKKASLLVFLTLCLMWVLFWLRGNVLLDPDFGWHLRMGELIVNQGIPKTDPFSYSMPSFPYIDHEWLTNVYFFYLYPKIGMLGLSSLYASFSVLALYLVLPKKNLQLTLGPLLLGFSVVFPFSGVRPQIQTWLFLSLLFSILLNQDLWKKFKFTLPFLFLVWANLHGGFALGIILLAISLSLQFWQKRKIHALDLFLFLLCVLATFITPFGQRMWEEVWRSATDSSLRFSISEWIPIIFRFDISFVFLFPLSSFFIWKYRKSLPVKALVLFFVLTLLSLSSQRHTPLWVLVILNLLPVCLYFLFNEVKKIQHGEERFKKIAVLFLIFCLVIFAGQSFFVLSKSKSLRESFYPQKAISFLLSTNTPGNLLAPYDWGGYLIWKMPGTKLFVDGRMPSWSQTPPNSKESQAAYKEYQELTLKKNSFSIFAQKYNITHVLWFKMQPKKEEQFEELIESWQGGLLAKLLNYQRAESLNEKLINEGWVKVYEDEVSTVYLQPSKSFL